VGQRCLTAFKTGTTARPALRSDTDECREVCARRGLGRPTFVRSPRDRKGGEWEFASARDKIDRGWDVSLLLVCHSSSRSPRCGAACRLRRRK
jgi:hypothetical protein